MKRVLIPTDFSENAWNALKYAVHLFKDAACKFYLLNTYTPVIYHLDYVDINPAQFMLEDPVRENSEMCLKELKSKIQNEIKNPEHEFECKAAFNTLIHEIKDSVSDLNIDLIVMGTKGATGAREILFGSNTVHVFKGVSCPVLAVPESFEFEKPMALLFPTDYMVEFTREQIQPILDIAKLHHSQINIMHVFYGEELTEVQERNKETLTSYFEGLSLQVHDVSNKIIGEAISDFQIRFPITMLVMANNKHSFFENLFFRSRINQIGFHLNIPFLVVPTKDK